MKSLKLFIAALGLSAAGFASAQVNPGTTPCTAGCSTSGSYSSTTGSASLGTYGCLYSTPNPNWIAIGIGTSGDVHLTLTQVNSGGSGIDVDFAAYGPFTSVSAGCATIGPGASQVDCSYSASATESIDIYGAVAGQVYIILITNYNGSAGTISVQPSTSSPSTATINCSINFSVAVTMTPAKCGQSNGTVTATPSGGYAPYTYSWNIPGNPTTATVNNVPPGTYTVTVTSSPNPTTGQTVNPTTGTVTVTNQTAVFTATSTPASCPGGHDGTATANYTMQGGTTGLTASYLWSDGQTTKIATGLTPGSYTVTVTLSNGCTGTATVTVGANAVAYNASSTLVSCPGGSDGTATAVMTPVIGTLSYAWTDPNAQTTPTAYNLSAGSYSCTITSSVGCTGTVNVTVNEIPGMTVLESDMIPANCNSANTGIMEVEIGQGTAPYSYSWDVSSSTGNSASDLYAGEHTVTITDANGCVITHTDTVTEPDPLQITMLTESGFICPESSTTLQVAGAGGNGTYVFNWTANGAPIPAAVASGNSIIVDPSQDVTQYCVTITEACGSPTADSCMTLTFPPAIDPKYETDKIADCEPARFEFNPEMDTSLLQSVLIEFGDGQQVLLENGVWDTAHVYQHHGAYVSSATVTSIYGCVTYNDSLTNLTAIQLPVADFAFSSNPTTMFETTVKMQDRSSYNVDQWTWFSPFSVPSASNYQNPEFTFPEGETGSYDVQLIVETPEGCIDTVVRTLTVISDILFYAPNAFTPDGDEFNQTWKFYVDGIDIYSFELVIFNRWGEIVWETKDPSAEWDGTYHGKVIETGALTWRARVKAFGSDEKREFTGGITVIR